MVARPFCRVSSSPLARRPRISSHSSSTTHQQYPYGRKHIKKWHASPLQHSWLPPMYTCGAAASCHHWSSSTGAHTLWYHPESSASSSRVQIHRTNFKQNPRIIYGFSHFAIHHVLLYTKYALYLVFSTIRSQPPKYGLYGKIRGFSLYFGELQFL